MYLHIVAMRWRAQRGDFHLWTPSSDAAALGKLYFLSLSSKITKIAGGKGGPGIGSKISSCHCCWCCCRSSICWTEHRMNYSLCCAGEAERRGASILKRLDSTFLLREEGAVRERGRESGTERGRERQRDRVRERAGKREGGMKGERGRDEGRERERERWPSITLISTQGLNSLQQSLRTSSWCVHWALLLNRKNTFSCKLHTKVFKLKPWNMVTRLCNQCKDLSNMCILLVSPTFYMITFLKPVSNSIHWRLPEPYF